MLTQLTCLLIMPITNVLIFVLMAHLLPIILNNVCPYVLTNLMIPSQIISLEDVWKFVITGMAMMVHLIVLLDVGGHSLLTLYLGCACSTAPMGTLHRTKQPCVGQPASLAHTPTPQPTAVFCNAPIFMNCTNLRTGHA